MVFFWVALTGIGLFGLLVSEAAGLRPMAYVTKPLASTGFIALAIHRGALDDAYGMVLLAGLALSWIGDQCLLARGAPRMFLAGLGAFLLGHLAYMAAFILLEPNWLHSAIAMVALVVTAGVVARWLDPYLQDNGMRSPVHVYIAVITCMVAVAAGTFDAGASPLVLAGAFGFYLSDLAVARDAFVSHSYINRLWGLPLYYGAQLCLAWTAGM